MVVAFDQRDIGPGLGGGPCRGAARRSAADHGDVAFVVDGDVARILADGSAAIAGREGAAVGGEYVGTEETFFAMALDPLNPDFVFRHAPLQC